MLFISSIGASPRGLMVLVHFRGVPPGIGWFLMKLRFCLCCASLALAMAAAANGDIVLRYDIAKPTVAIGESTKISLFADITGGDSLVHWGGDFAWGTSGIVTPPSSFALGSLWTAALSSDTDLLSGYSATPVTGTALLCSFDVTGLKVGQTSLGFTQTPGDMLELFINGANCPVTPTVTPGQVSVVPEPTSTTLALLGLGLTGLVRRRLR